MSRDQEQVNFNQRKNRRVGSMAGNKDRQRDLDNQLSIIQQQMDNLSKNLEKIIKSTIVP